MVFTTTARAPRQALEAATVVHMRDRIGGQDAIEEVLQHQAETRGRGRIAQLIGLSPISSVGEPLFNIAVGESAVGDELMKLPREWTVFNALPIGLKSADIDHVVVGPGGVFAITARRHLGRKLIVDRANVMVNGLETQHVTRAMADARRLEKMLAFHNLANVAVRPVVAVVGASDISYAEHPTKFELRDALTLVGWLKKRPAALSSEQVADIVAKLDEPVLWRKFPEPDADLMADFDQLRTDVDSAKNVRRMWFVGGITALIVAAAAAGIPTIIAIIGGAVPSL